jgi:hypothetical protein
MARKNPPDIVQFILGTMASSCGTLFTWGGNFSGKGNSHRGALGTGDEAGRMLPTRRAQSSFWDCKGMIAFGCDGSWQGRNVLSVVHLLWTRFR